jgi:thiol-disulfide isomerase/thioredoxin
MAPHSYPTVAFSAMNETLPAQIIAPQAIPTIVYVRASWCGPCRTMSPTIERVAADFAHRVQLVKVDAGAQPQLVQQLRVVAVPTVILWRDGRELCRNTGAQTEAMLRGLFEAAATGLEPPRPGLHPASRVLRIAASLALLVLGWLSGPSPVLLVAAGLLLFSAVHDRCPLWRALAPRLQALFASLPSGR